jgi:uncharacterized Zn finger protein
MAEALDRDPWLLFDLRGNAKEEVMAALQEALNAAAVQAPKKRGRPKKNAQTVSELLAHAEAQPEPWHSMPEDDFDTLHSMLPELAIPRVIPPDPSVFTQLGPLPHARIESSLCLAALMHRTAQWVLQQIEVGPQQLEGGEPMPEEFQQAASPFDSPIALRPVNKPWRNKRRRWNKN